MNIESLSLSTKSGIAVFVLGAFFLVAYTIYIYRFTLPAISSPKKTLLNVLRGFALLLIALMLIEPVLVLVRSIREEPVHVVLIDNSSSMEKVSGNRKKSEAARAFLDELRSAGIPGEFRFMTFGGKPRLLSADSLGSLSFREPSTAFYPAFSEIKKSDANIRSVTLVSDGILTEGEDPSTLIEGTGIPVFTVALGDTAVNSDLSVADISASDIIYAGTSAPVRVNILSRRIRESGLEVSLFEEGELLEKKAIDVREGNNTVLFNYLPKKSGERKLTAAAAALPAETNKENNVAVRFVNIRDSKVKAVLIAGAPSADVTFVKQALESDTNITCRTIIELGQNKFLTPYNEKVLDSADVFFFLQFPLPGTSPQLFSQLLTRLRDAYKPFFLILGENFSPQMLQQIDNLLPLSVRRNNGGSIPAQPLLTEQKARHPLLKDSDPALPAIWSNLAPVPRPNIDAPPKPESEVLLTLKTANAEIDIPFFAVRNLGSQRSAMLLASDIWRWRLMNSSQEDLFTQLFRSSFKWLQAGGDRDRLKLKTDKKSYAAGETVRFYAEYYDESFNPVSDAILTVNRQKGANRYSFVLNPIGNGLYEYAMASGEKGDYEYSGSTEDRGKRITSGVGRYSVGDTDPEMISTVTDAGFLKYLSTVSGGSFFLNGGYSSLTAKLKEISEKSIREKKQSSETDIWQSPFLLGIVILLLAAEWFIRKREGML